MPVPEIPINMDTSPTVILDLIYRLKIKDVMSATVITAAKDDSLRSIQNIMKEKHLTGVPIVQGKRLIGLVSVDDIINALDKGYIEDPAGKRMSRSLIVLEEDMPISFAIRYFDRYQFHRYPVLNKQKELVGMLTSRDISVPFCWKSTVKWRRWKNTTVSIRNSPISTVKPIPTPLRRTISKMRDTHRRKSRRT